MTEEMQVEGAEKEAPTKEQVGAMLASMREDLATLINSQATDLVAAGISKQATAEAMAVQLTAAAMVIERKLRGK